MNCEIAKYNYCTIYGKTVFETDYKIDEATSESEVFFDVRSNRDSEKWTVDNGKLQRIDAQTWRVVERTEHLKPNVYEFKMTFKTGSVERVVLEGVITVKR